MNIKEMPKVILHLHLDGSLRPATVYEWLREAGSNLTLEEVRKQLMVDRDCRNLNQYLTKFMLPIEVLQTKEHIKRATYELFEDLSKENVIYAEVRFAPSLHLNTGLTFDEIVEASIKGMNEAKQNFGIEGNLILCCMRDGKNCKETNMETVKIAKKFLNKGVCGLDLAGAEALFKTDDFAEEFELAKKLQIPFTIHAGEAAGADSIRKALQFGATRIGHGVRCIEDEELMHELVQKKILLEICPISNLQTQAVNGKHPLEKIYKAGIPVCINTDNNSVSNTNLETEYQWVLDNTNLKKEDLQKMNVNAIRGAFVNPVQKATLISKFQGRKTRNEER